MRIAYCLNSIRYLGGIQRVTIVKANALADLPNYEVYIIVTDNKQGVQIEQLSSKVKLIDLEVNYYEDDWKSKFNVVKGIVLKRREHHKKLKKVLNMIQPDIVISIGQSEKNIVPSIKGKWKTIREFHFVCNYRILHAQSFFDKILAKGGDFYERFFTLKKYDQIVLLTEEDRETNWKGWNKIVVIPNPKSFTCEKVSSLQNPIVVSAGRLNRQKNYKDLIEAFSTVVRKHPEWKLEIYGEGEERLMLEEVIASNNLSNNVFLKGLSTNIIDVFCNASIAAFTSISEGFLLSIIEAFECGLPVVSYTCPCGPKEIIEDGVNGFLVPVGDKALLSKKILGLIEHPEMMKQMSIEAKKRAADYSIKIVIKKWTSLFEELCKLP